MAAAPNAPDPVVPDLTFRRPPSETHRRYVITIKRRLQPTRELMIKVRLNYSRVQDDDLNSPASPGTTASLQSRKYSLVDKPQRTPHWALDRRVCPPGRVSVSPKVRGKTGTNPCLISAVLTMNFSPLCDCGSVQSVQPHREQKTLCFSCPLSVSLITHVRWRCSGSFVVTCDRSYFAHCCR
jgi:hypothetical protein